MSSSPSLIIIVFRVIFIEFFINFYNKPLLEEIQEMPVCNKLMLTVFAAINAIRKTFR